MAVITISRDMGSGGKSIAALVADRLGYGCVDKTLILEVAREASVPESEVERFDEKYVNPVKQWLRALFVQPWDMVVNPPQTLSFADAAGLTVFIPDGDHILDSDDYHDFLEMIITRLWRKNNMVIVGRGAQRILAGKRETFHIRITAPPEVRCGRIMERENLDYDDAMALINKTDNARARYFKRRYQNDWADPTLYHLVINTGMTSQEEACLIICDATRQMIATARQLEEES